MKMKWGAFVVEGRNKIGGHVASKNRHGSYLRTKVTPVNRMSTRQTVVRTLLTNISQSWRSLTAAQRAAWNAAVNDFKKTDIFGDIQTPSGFNLYQKINNNLQSLGVAMVTTPPVVSDLDQFTALALTYAVGTPALSLAFTVAAGTDSGYKVFATAPMSAGKNFVKSEYRQITQGTTAPTSPLNLLSAYQAVFGNVGNIGDKIFVKIVPVGAVSGVQGLATATSAISAA